jgi:bifunctional non-homologous end joining protein LigD
MLPRIRPMRLKLVKQPFDSPDYIFELKHDGWRAIAYIQKNECKLISRNNNGLRFRTLAQNLGNMKVDSAIIDGEIVSLDPHGKSIFNRLLEKNAQVVFYAFDLLWLNGTDLRQQPLITRKEMLKKLVKANKLRWLYASHTEEKGKTLFSLVCEMDVEGIVAKRKQSIYKDDGIGWLKIKNPKYSQLEGRRKN